MRLIRGLPSTAFADHFFRTAESGHRYDRSRARGFAGASKRGSLLQLLRRPAIQSRWLAWRILRRKVARRATRRARRPSMALSFGPVSRVCCPRGVEVCVALGVRERPPLPDHRDYMAFVDFSGGSADSMTLAVGHKGSDVVVIDPLRERKPSFSPDAVVDEFAMLLASYPITKVSGRQIRGFMAGRTICCAQCDL